MSERLREFLETVAERYQGYEYDDGEPMAGDAKEFLRQTDLAAERERVLVEAVWQVLDDMGKDGLCCCGAVKAQLRIAYEPFNDGEAEPDMTLEKALEIEHELNDQGYAIRKAAKIDKENRMSERTHELLAEILRKAQGRTDAETGKDIDVGYEISQLRKYSNLAAERERELIQENERLKEQRNRSGVAARSEFLPKLKVAVDALQKIRDWPYHSPMRGEARALARAALAKIDKDSPK